MIKSKLSHSLSILFQGSNSNSISALTGLGALEPASWHKSWVEHPQRCSSLAYAHTHIRNHPTQWAAKSACAVCQPLSRALGPTSQHITSPPPTPRKHNQIPPKHHHQTERLKAGAYKKNRFGYRTGWWPCAHSIGKFFVLLMFFFPLKLPPWKYWAGGRGGCSMLVPF